MAGDRRGSLFERGKELAAIGRHLDRAREGDGSLVAIDGPAGIGKTALVCAARELAARA